MPIFKSSVIYSYYFTLIRLQKCPYKAFHLQENPWKLLWQIQVFNNFKIITLDWVRIFKILIKNRLIHKGANPRWNKIEVSYREQNKRVKKTIIFMTIYNITGSLMLCFPYLRKTFSLFFEATYDLEQGKTITFLSAWFLQNLEALIFIFSWQNMYLHKFNKNLFAL